LPDNDLRIEILKQIIQAIETIKYRFEPVQCVDDFLDTPAGREKLESICMLFIAIGESLKKLDKITDKKLLSNYPHIDWKAIKGLRDVLSHHYFDINAEAIYDVCVHDLDTLYQTIQNILCTLKNQ